MREQHQDFPGFWQAILIVGLLLFVEVLIGVALHESGVTFGIGDPAGYVVVTLSCGLVLSVLMAYKRLGYRGLFSPSGLSFDRVVVPLLFPLLCLAFGFIVLEAELSNLLVRLWPLSAGEKEYFTGLVSGGVASVVTLCVLAPAIEEMLFRGLFLRSFLHRYLPWRAIVLSAVIFGAMHMNIYQLFSAFFFGLASGWLYCRARSLWPPILLHALYHGGGLALALLAPDSAGFEPVRSFPVQPVPLLVVAIAALTFGVQRIRATAPGSPDAST